MVRLVSQRANMIMACEGPNNVVLQSAVYRAIVPQLKKTEKVTGRAPMNPFPRSCMVDPPVAVTEPFLKT